MATNVYEALFILDANRYGRDPSGVSGQIADLIKKHEGEVLVSRLWEERRLAYPINGQRKGVYWLSYFRLDPAQLSAITREWRISDNVVRSLVLKVDPRIVETLVAHANAGPTEAARARRVEPIKVRRPEAALDVPPDLELN